MIANNAASPRQIAVFGGTFDPVHWGHLRPVLDLADQCHWERIHLLPTCAPPHRQQPEVLNTHRLGMLDAAATLDSRLYVNDWELRQGMPSRTLPTLKHFRERCPDATLVFIIGMDSLLLLPEWLHWERLFDYAHFVVMPRPGYSLDDARPELKELLAQRQISLTELSQGHGGIYIAESTPVDISATELRSRLSELTECPEFLPEPVWKYIQKHHLYGVG
ncbi:nicotinate-nucleotide adenylyltransferase [Aliidiomarina halalkaliphila]|uniref:Probable nicotinate-nucleotide adenylyltransferase n=1 Tax=Aliidiomarina halalkaliphila TaxID=2593535 RepID=A0A552X331_9GAMM|nr:nicotinate-nucleotide adenylyltransferase [Aliidiomarina halalkaliphila]TRW49417.1 nicotinate-nucleotide adenylyltransferase [Aliidiomarina halalkaliphila]